MRREACIPCRDRKLRCDVSRNSPVPCTRCVKNSRDVECIIPPRQKRRILRRGKRQQPPPCTETSDYIPREGTLSISDEFNDPAWDELVEPCGATSQPGAVVEDEDDILQHACEQIAMPQRISRIAPPSTKPWVAIMEYQNPLNAAGILGELVAQYHHANRIIKIDQSPSAAAIHPTLRTRRQLELQGLDEHEIAFLTTKKAFSLPPRDVCVEFFSNFFTFAHPYAPILDRCTFLTQFDRQDYSLFVVQAILANAVPYATHDLIRRAGLANHQDALRAFFKRAVLLYDFNCEKDQLSLLQGSLLLGVQWISHVHDKDYRFWMATAIRLAMRMGLHRRHIEEELDPGFYRLLKRIWCVIWVRDVLLVTTGLDNGRKVSDDCDTIELAEEDWNEDTSNVSDDLRNCLPAINATQKQFFIHLSRLAVIGREAHATILSRQPSQIDHGQTDNVLGLINSWRQALPFQLTPDAVKSWTSEGIWVLVLAAWCCRIECHIHRTIWRSSMQAEMSFTPPTRGLQDSVFKLDVVIKRAVLHGLCRLMPLSISTSAAVNVAVAIELLCQPDNSPGEKSIYQEAVRNGVLFLKETQETWSTIRALLRLFAWVLAKKGLSFVSGLEDAGSNEVNHGGLSVAPSLSAQTGIHAHDETNINPLLFTMDSFFDLQGWNDSTILRAL